ncbi:MAG TPA: DsbE family thiol:disulfide interchange protein [Caulobacteraceae bacterium]|jgi:cytochrome c biogenesis protein CcmG/thiol:disulfide interchange protein DsbE|nr:DsbE family thiol:disulfide interchange protein [Caulobacteraceae bacterium]
MRRLLFLMPLAAFALVGLAFLYGLGRDPTHLPSTLIGKQLPAFNLPPVRAGDVGLKTQDLSGQPVLLNVFASWCVSCRIEHPMLLQLKAEGINVEGLDWKDEAAAGAQYLAENGDPYALVGNDRTGRAGIDLGVAGVPETFVVDRKGRVRYKHIGPIEPDDWARTIKPLMDRLRAES